MHLGIRVPNTWFRASFQYDTKDINGVVSVVTVTGLTLPGVPNMVVGSNGHIAWGFTNSYGDWSDIIILETNQDGSEYKTPNGFVPFEEHTQIIAIKDQESAEFTIKETIWGPVIGKNEKKQLLAYRWVAHDKQAINMQQLKLEVSYNIDDAFKVAAISGLPEQNFAVADK